MKELCPQAAGPAAPACPRCGSHMALASPLRSPPKTIILRRSEHSRAIGVCPQSPLRGPATGRAALERWREVGRLPLSPRPAGRKLVPKRHFLTFRAQNSTVKTQRGSTASILVTCRVSSGGSPGTQAPFPPHGTRTGSAGRPRRSAEQNPHTSPSARGRLMKAARLALRGEPIRQPRWHD